MELTYLEFAFCFLKYQYRLSCDLLPIDSYNRHTPGAVAYYNAYFGRGTGPILLDDLLCTGSEARLVDCTHDGIGNYDFCSNFHYDDAGVRCQQGIYN